MRSVEVDLSLDADLAGDERVRRLLRLMQRRARDLSDPLDEFGDYYAAFHAFRFLRSGEFIGTKRWRPLSPAYKARKTAAVGPQPILTRTGRLSGSLNHRPFDVDRVTPDSATFGTKTPYAKYHQTGTRFMPKRVVIPPLQPAQGRLLRKIVADHILPEREARAFRAGTFLP